MKARNGFVSNSSSSSFLMRGAKFKLKDILATLKIDVEADDYDEWDVEYTIEKELKKLGIKLGCRSTRYYFSEDKTEEVIIGKDLNSLDDGAVTEIKCNPKIDATIMEKLAKIDGLKNVKLATFIQYVSNDNY